MATNLNKKHSDTSLSSTGSGPIHGPGSGGGSGAGIHSPQAGKVSNLAATWN